jgi:MFS family permease
MWTLAVLMLAYVMSYIDRQIMALMVDPVRAGLGISDFQISLLQGFAFALFFSIMGIPLGRLSDQRSRVILIAAGITWWSIMTVLCGFAGSFAALFLFRMGVGLGEAALAPAAYSILGDTFPPHRLVRATSLFGQATTIGAGLSLLVGGQLVDAIGSMQAVPFGLAPWQFAFVVVGSPGVLVAALVLTLKEPVRRNRSAHQDMSFAQALTSLWQKRARLLPLYVSGTLLAVINFAAVTWFPTHLIRAFHLSAGEAGLLLAPIQIFGGLAGAALGAFLTERFIRKEHAQPYLRTVAIVALVMMASMVIPLLPALTPVIALWAVAVVFQGAYAGSVMAAIQVSVPNEQRGLATALLLLLSNLGGLGLGSALIGGLSSMLFPSDPAGVGKALAAVGFACTAASAAIAWRYLRLSPGRPMPS